MCRKANLILLKTHRRLNSYNFWYSYGKIDTTHVSDGDYEVAFLLSKMDGTYSKTVLGTVTVTAGLVNIH